MPLFLGLNDIFIVSGLVEPSSSLLQILYFSWLSGLLFVTVFHIGFTALILFFVIFVTVLLNIFALIITLLCPYGQIIKQLYFLTHNRVNIYGNIFKSKKYFCSNKR